MTIRKIIGLITIAAAVPHIGFLFYFVFIYHASMVSWTVIEKILITFTCISGGALLWSGGIWGYRISIIAWILLLFVSFSSLYVTIFHTPIEEFQAVLLTRDAIISSFGCIILFILLRDLINFKQLKNPFQNCQ